MLDCIDLDQDIPGHREFVSCWLQRGEDLTFVVDPGPTGTIPALAGQLRGADVERLDLILITHIHLDHGGGAGTLARLYPEARICCHPAGERHLVEPERLWQGSLEVLGDIARVYGPPEPVAAERLCPVGELADLGILALPTPGHAPHHLAYRHEDTLFCGEAAGTWLPTPNGPYSRPATPPRFFLDTALASLEALATTAPPPTRVALGHHGLAPLSGVELPAAAADSLRRWVDIVGRISPDGKGDLETVLPEVRRLLLAEDPWYRHFPALEPDIRERELAFTRQSVRGILGWLAAR